MHPQPFPGFTRPVPTARRVVQMAAPTPHRQQQPHAAQPARRVLRVRLARPPGLDLLCQALPAGQQQGATPPVHADYAAKAGDSAVLQRPLKAELLPEEIQNVFGYPRNLKDK